MPRKKLTEKTLSENQEGLFAIANALLVDIDVTIYAKLVFGYIIKLSGRDISKEDGYAHVSNAEMRKGCEIGSDTMTNAVVELVNAGLITVERGKKRSKGEKGVENRYFLPDEIKEKMHFKTNSSVYSTEKNQQMEEVLKRIESLELRINELTEENRILSEKVETLEKKRKSSMDMEMDMEINSYNSSCIHLSNLNNSTQNTIPDKSCSMSDEEKDTGSEYTQPDPVPYVFDERYFDSTPEPVKRKKKSSAVSSSLQIIEEENHPDTGDNDSSNDERTTADRLSSSQSDSKTQPQPLDKGKEYREVLSAVRQKLDSAVDELMEEEAEKLFAKLSMKKSDEIPDDVKRLVYEKVSAIAEEHPDYYDTYKSVQGFKSWGELIKETVEEMCRRLVEKDPKSHVTAYSDFENTPIIVREAT